MPTDKKTTEHHATMHDPDKYIKFATMKDKGGRGVNFIMGISKKGGPEGGHSEIQSVRFDAKLWPVKKAKQWLKDNNMTSIKFTPATIKEDGEPAITTSTMGDAQYAPKVLPMASHYGDFKKDRFDQSFMASMKRKLNESVVKEEIKGKIKVGDIIADEDGKRFRVDNIGNETIRIIPEDGEYADGIKVLPSDIYEFYTTVKESVVAEKKNTGINNPDYLFYNVVDGKIVSGWEYKEDAQDDKKEMEEDGRAVKTLQRKGLKAIGLNPDNDKDWGGLSRENKVTAEESETTPETSMDEASKLSPIEQKAIDVLNVHPDNQLIVKKDDTEMTDVYFSLCQKGLCRWNINDDGTITFTLE